MATLEMSILNHTFAPDSSGDVYPAPIDQLLTMTNAKKQMAWVMAFPTGSDVAAELSFRVPQEYVGSPVLVIQGILDGTPAGVLAFGCQLLARADSEAVDTAYEAEDTASNSTWTGYADEDSYVETITLTPSSAFVAGERVYLKFYRDDSVDTTTFDFILEDLLFQFSDT